MRSRFFLAVAPLLVLAGACTASYDPDEMVDGDDAVSAEVQQALVGCTPSPEVCGDDIDNDCDGQVDEISPEVCDGVDNDCDGVVDEDIPGDACNTGLPGVCATGMLQCIAGGTTCVPTSFSTPEVCDGLDNDCDGVVDEGIPVDACNTGLPGVCAAGMSQCIAGGNTCIQTHVPTSEVCDGVDNDCDGQIDEDAIPEVAGDGIDNDCDGLIDETPKYDLDGEVIIDTMTGLTWQRSVTLNKYNWPDAQDYCTNLELGGYNDWRLPSKYELRLIVDTSRYDPAIDVVAFPNTPSRPFWTSSGYGYSSYFAVDFWIGLWHQSFHASQLLYVRCVR